MAVRPAAGVAADGIHGDDVVVPQPAQGLGLADAVRRDLDDDGPAAQIRLAGQEGAGEGAAAEFAPQFKAEERRLRLGPGRRRGRVQIDELRQSRHPEPRQVFVDVTVDVEHPPHRRAVSGEVPGVGLKVERLAGLEAERVLLEGQVDDGLLVGQQLGVGIEGGAGVGGGTGFAPGALDRRGEQFALGGCGDLGRRRFG